MADWIDKQEPLQALLAELAQAPALALDTEFERIRTYWPKLALMQLNPPKPAALVDTTAPLDWQALGKLLAEAPLLIMHSASEDLVALRALWPRPAKALFDTQIAASLSGVGHNLSYQKLVAQMLSVDLPKGETRSDWMKRPLSANQLDYAIDDVRYLNELHAALVERLSSQGRLHWVLQEGERMLTQAARTEIEPNLHHDYRNAWQLNLEQQQRLDQLLVWREDMARQLDRPRTWIMEHASAWKLAEHPPSTLQGLTSVLAQERSFPKAKAQSLLKWLHEPVTPRDRFLPAPKPADKADEIRYKSLRLKIDALATELGIDPGALISRRVLEFRLRTGTWTPETAPWRIELLEPLLG